MDRIAPELNEKVIAQIGVSSYIPKNLDYFREASIDEINKYLKEARIVISHAGVGSIITALKYGKPLILVPRIKKFREHNSDHQIEIANAIETEKKAYVVYDICRLHKAINLAIKNEDSISETSQSVLFREKSKNNDEARRTDCVYKNSRLKSTFFYKNKLISFIRDYLRTLDAVD
jgi:UDP-N-acetylglucosamine transferase subunit ALG13